MTTDDWDWIFTSERGRDEQLRNQLENPQRTASRAQMHAELAKATDEARKTQSLLQDFALDAARTAELVIARLSRP